MILDLRSSTPIVPMSIPSIKIFPSDGSINLNNVSDIVDFPDPVLSYIFIYKKKKKIN